MPVARSDRNNESVHRPSLAGGAGFNPGVAGVLATVLGTTLLRGLAVSVLAFVIAVGVIVVLSMTVSGLGLAFYSR